MSPTFWGWALSVFCGLTLSGFFLARLLLPVPLNYVYTSYLSLALPKDWRCARESTAYVCGVRPDTGNTSPHQAVVIFAAKKSGDRDSFTAYREHLETPRRVGGNSSKIEYSVVEDVTERRIAGRRWIVGRHLHSEISNYRTWYFATVADDIAVLVTFSAHQDFAEFYVEDVETALEHLKLNKQARSH